MNLIIIGPSGSGKGTQAQLIAKKYNLNHISMGQLMRDEIKAQTSFGKQAEKTVNAGKWASADLTLKILKPYLGANFLLDGCPRILDQAQGLTTLLNLEKLTLTAVILLDVTEEEILKRQSQSGDQFQDQARPDNDPKILAQRLRSYKETIRPILAYYKKRGQLKKINGNRPVDPIFKDICAILDPLL